MVAVRHTAALAPPPRLSPQHPPQRRTGGPASRQGLIIGSRWPATLPQWHIQLHRRRIPAAQPGRRLRVRPGHRPVPAVQAGAL